MELDLVVRALKQEPPITFEEAFSCTQFVFQCVTSNHRNVAMLSPLGENLHKEHHLTNYKSRKALAK